MDEQEFLNNLLNYILEGAEEMPTLRKQIDFVVGGVVYEIIAKRANGDTQEIKSIKLLSDNLASEPNTIRVIQLLPGLEKWLKQKGWDKIPAKVRFTPATNNKI